MNEVVVVNGRIYSFMDTQDPEVIYIDAQDLKSKLYDGITIGRLKKYLKCDSYEDTLELLRHMFRYYISINNIVLASAVFKYAYFMHIRVYDEYSMGLKPMMELFDRLRFCHSGSGKYNGHHRYTIDEWTLYLEKSGKKSTHSPERIMHEATADKVEEYMQSMDLDIGDDSKTDDGINKLEIPDLELGDAVSTTVYSYYNPIGKYTDYHVFKQYGDIEDDNGTDDYEIPELDTVDVDDGTDDYEIPELE